MTAGDNGVGCWVEVGKVVVVVGWTRALHQKPGHLGSVSVSNARGGPYLGRGGPVCGGVTCD